MPTRIGQRIATVVKDNSVTAQEAKELVDLAKAEPKWTPGMQAELQKVVSRRGASFEPGAKEALESFLSTAKTQVDLPDPLVQKKDRTSTVWTPASADAKLYVDGVSGDDVTQGYLGDCYFVSSMSSLAYANPDLIKNAIKDNGNGTYDVRFYENTDGPGKAKPVTVTVDSDIAADKSGNPQYAKARDPKELWVGLMEKAYAKWKGGYERVGAGGAAADVFAAVTGKSGNQVFVKDFTPDKVFDLLTKQTQAHHPVAAGTFSDNDPKVHYDGTGVHGDHFYTVMGTSVENGQKYVQLRNPWGESEPANNGPDDGIFKLPLADFVKLYDNVDYGG